MSHSMTRRTSILRTVLLTAVPVLLLAKGGEVQIGRASCRERVYVLV